MLIYPSVFLTHNHPAHRRLALLEQERTRLKAWYLIKPVNSKGFTVVTVCSSGKWPGESPNKNARYSLYSTIM